MHYFFHIGGNAASADFIKNSDVMWKQSVWSSTLASAVASKHLKEGGLLTLTGAQPALKSTVQSAITNLIMFIM